MRKILPVVHGLFRRPAWRSFLWAVLILLAAVLVNVIGIHAFGGVEGWQHWLDGNANIFLAWRIALYACVGWCWVRMRLRLREREPGRHTRQRLLRIEIATVLTLLALETSLLGGSEMTFYTSDYLDYYLTLVGWLIHNGIWSVLVASGAFALPFIAIIVGEWLKARSEGADEGNKGVLSSVRIESRIWVAIFVVLFAGIPFIDVDMATIKFDRTRSVQCQVNVPLPENTGWSKSFTSMNNQSAKVPVWWAVMHGISRGVTGAAVAAIPCGADIRQMRIEIDSTRIKDPVLAQEVADFSRDCYGPARAKLFMNRPQLSDAQLNDVSWIGSKMFVSTAGYYDSYRSGTPRTAWPYDSTRDAGLAQVPSGGGYPTCRQWWSDGTNGLRARLLEQVDASLLTRVAGWASFMSRSDVDDSVLRAVSAPQKQTMVRGEAYTDYGGQIGMSAANVVTRAASDLGQTLGSLGFFPAMDVMRQALPMVLSFLKMALVICLPLMLVIGVYELKSVVVISVVQFALFFIDFWFQLARWVDSTIINAMYGWHSPFSNLNPLIGINNSFGDMLLNYVMAAMFIVLPGFWMAGLSWVGVRAGQSIQGLTDGTRASTQAGGKAVGLASNKLK